MNLSSASFSTKTTGNQTYTLNNTPENIDRIIKQSIERLTAENNTIWSSPDHNRREYAHCFFQYPAMMVPVVQKRVIDIIKAAKPEIQSVIDPFMGSATSLVACMQNGLDCHGQDINPLSILIAHARTGPYYVKAIKKRFKLFISTIENDKSRLIESKFQGRTKWFKENVSIELSRIIRAIRQEPKISIRKFYWINLAEIARLTSNDRTSTFKLHARPINEIEARNISPIEEFKCHLKQSLDDLELYRRMLEKSSQLVKGSYKGILKFHLQDSSKRIIPPQADSLYDLLVTSPPYGDNKTTVTYGQHSYLPLQWIDLNDIHKRATKDFLKTTLEIDSRSLGGKVKRLSREELDLLYTKSETFRNIHQRLEVEASDKADKVVVFLKDLFQVIENVFKVMKPNSYQVWTIGNRTVGGLEIPNNQILREFIEYKGGVLVTQIEREILNKRMAKRNSNSALMTFENILIFRKVG